MEECKFKVGQSVVIKTNAFTSHENEEGIVEVYDGFRSYRIRFSNGDLEPFSEDEVSLSKNEIIYNLIQEL